LDLAESDLLVGSDPPLDRLSRSFSKSESTMIPNRTRLFGRGGALSPFAVLCLTLALAGTAMAQGETYTGAGCAEGMRLAAERQYEKASVELISCLESEGEALAPLVALTAMALDQDHKAEALDWSFRAVTAFPDSVEAEYWHGRSLAVTGDVAGAREAWEHGLQLNQVHAPTIRALANLLLSLGEERPAYGLLNHLIHVDGPDAWTLKTMSNLARKNGLWRQALTHWDTALGLQAPDAADMRVAGELAILAGDTAYAVMRASEAVELEPGPASWGVLGEALFASQRIGEAIPLFESVLEADPGSSAVRFHLANAYELVGRVEDAGAEFLRYTAQQPGDPAGFINYAVHLEKQGLTTNALRQAEQAVLLAPDQLQPALLRANLLEKLGDDLALAEAIDDLLARGIGNAEELSAWRLRLDDRLASDAGHAGKVMLLHIVTPDSTAVRLIEEDILDGLDFSVIATRYSVGATAGQGGDIGWVDPQDMTADLRKVIRELHVQEVSRSIPSEGLFHFFKRVR
jgi:tetratricopeptide (TPR) repeat protein